MSGRLVGIAAAALAVAVVVWLAVGGDDGGESEPGAPQAASADELRALSASVGHDVFWAGNPGPDETLELSHEEDGRIYVRYLSGDAGIGEERAAFTTVGTYPVQSPLAALRREARGPEAITRDLPGGGFAYMSAGRPTSVHLAWPGSDFEVEVYDPSPKHALDLVLSGAIVPVS